MFPEYRTNELYLTGERAVQGTISQLWQEKLSIIKVLRDVALEVVSAQF
jgi:hypothetical protein